MTDTNLPQLYWLNFEVEGDEGEDETLDILNKVVEDTQAFWVLTFRHVHQRPNLRSLEGDVIIAQSNFKLLLAHNILLWPIRIVFLDNFAGLDDSLQLLDDQWADPHLFPDETVIAVV